MSDNLKESVPTTGLIEPVVVVDLLRRGMAQGQLPALTIVSNSMSPLFYIDDKVFVESVTISDLAVGDVVVAQTTYNLMTHRFWGWMGEADNRQLLMRGDRLLLFDSLLPASALVGRVVARERAGNKLWLNAGKGATLNRWLTQIALFEMRLFDLPLPADTNLPAPYAISRLFTGKRTISLRLIHRAIYHFSRLLAWFITFP